MAVLIAVLGVVMALASIASVVPRIRLVEAIGLFATAFAAGAAAAVTVASLRGRPR
jgi:hypothetical protein